MKVNTFCYSSFASETMLMFLWNCTCFPGNDISTDDWQTFVDVIHLFVLIFNREYFYLIFFWISIVFGDTDWRRLINGIFSNDILYFSAFFYFCQFHSTIQTHNVSYLLLCNLYSAHIFFPLLSYFCVLFLFSLHHPLCWLFLFGCELCVSFPGGVNIWICALNTKSRIKSRIHFHFIMYAFKSFVVKNETRFASFLMCLFVDFFPPLLWLKYTIIMFQSVRKSNRNMRYAFQTRTFALFETMVWTFFLFLKYLQ